MAQFIFEIPDAQAQRIALAVCAREGYTPTGIADATERTKQHVFKYLASLVIEQEANAAAVAAADQVRGNASDPLAAALFTPVEPEPEPPVGPVGPTGPDGGVTGPVSPTGATGSMSLAAAIRGQR